MKKKLRESIGTRTDVENINQNQNDAKVVKLAKHLVKGEKISLDDFRLLRDKLSTPTYKMVDKGETYALQRGEEILYQWGKDNLVNEADCADEKKIIPDSEQLDDTKEIEEGHTDDIIAEVLELAKEQGKNWTEEALRKLTVPQLHVIKSKLINPEYKTRKEIAAEKEKEERQAKLVKTNESDGSVKYKIVLEDEEYEIEAGSDEEAIEKFDQSFGITEAMLKDTGIPGLKVASFESYKVYVKENADGKFSFIVRDRVSSKTLDFGDAETESEAIDKVNDSLYKLDNI